MFFAPNVYTYVVVLFIIELYIDYTAGSTKFTTTPINKTVYVGSEVKIEWDYTKVVDKNLTFGWYSPIWTYYNTSGAVFQLASESIEDNWEWKISPKCPTRLISPVTRIRKEGKATLVISNVILADSGKYECALKLRSGAESLSSMQLTVLRAPTTAPSTTGSTTKEDTSTTAASPTTGTDSPKPPSGDKGLSSGELAGIIIGVVVVLLIIIAVVIYFYKKSKDNRDQKDGSVTMTNKVDREGNQNA